MQLAKSGQTSNAIDRFADAIKIQQALRRSNPENLQYANHLGGTYNNLGMIYRRTGDAVRAEKYFSAGLRQHRFAHRASPQNLRYREHLSRNYFNYGAVLLERGRAVDAARIAWERGNLWPDSAEQLCSVSEQLARCCEQMEGEDQRQAWMRRGLELLDTAIDLGLNSNESDLTSSMSVYKSHPYAAPVLARISAQGE